MSSLISRNRKLNQHLLNLQTLTRLTLTTQRSLHSRVKQQSIPPPTPFVPTPSAFLTLIGRSLSQHASKFTDWNALFTLSGAQLRELGIEPARSRRYLLAWRDRFRRGEFGIGGDCMHVDADGRAEIRMVEVKMGSELEKRAWDMKHAGDTVDANRKEHGFRTAPATMNRTEGTRKIVVNVPVQAAGADGTPAQDSTTQTPEQEGEEAKELLDEGKTAEKQFRKLTPTELELAAPIEYVKILAGQELAGRSIRHLKGSSNTAAIIQVQEGLWEHKRGYKVDGGERRRTEVRAKKAAAARRAANR